MSSIGRMDLDLLPPENLPVLRAAMSAIAGLRASYTEERVQGVLDKLYELNPAVEIPKRLKRKVEKDPADGGAMFVWGWAVAEIVSEMRVRGDHEIADEAEAALAAMERLLREINELVEGLWPPPPPTWVPASRAAKYGITVDEGLDILMRQGVACAVCKVPFESPRRVRFDHNHATGAFRGFLCSSCNTGLGHLKDNPRIIAAAVEYLTDRGHYGTDTEETP